ncbi:hypothetical protein I79_017140 [Cricetulus griseus]|uniref:Uncharacterized protein n=1 Tax=Cricetulus griseus TaxID=10029 RepID=G3I190_CRIGR|nr:hypothetical protein I79_017140 [Cricetulus griseus]
MEYLSGGPVGQFLCVDVRGVFLRCGDFHFHSSVSRHLSLRYLIPLGELNCQAQALAHSTHRRLAVSWDGPVLS